MRLTDASPGLNEGAMPSTEVYLFAHPDDEFGVFFALEQAVARGAVIHCLYLTDGGFGGQTTDQRETETRRVLHRLGVSDTGIHFIGGRHGFHDGELSTRLEDAYAAIESLLDAIPQIDRLYLHAWECGHQDHDAAHLLGVAYAAKRSIGPACRQFPLYRVGPGFLGIATCKTLQDNGPVEARRIPWARRLKYITLCFSYHSQWKSFAYLLPALCLHYLFNGCQELQNIRQQRISFRPHDGPLLYERRGFYKYDSFYQCSRKFLNTYFMKGVPYTLMKSELIENS